MKFTIKRTSDRAFSAIEEQLPCPEAYISNKTPSVLRPEAYDFEYSIDIESLELLMEFSVRVGYPLVINGADMSIEIYDDWRE